MGSQTSQNLNLCQNRFDVRMMTNEDIEQVCDIEKSSFPTPWSAFAFASELEDNQLACYCVIVPEDEPKKVVGYCGMWVILDEAHITNIAILPDFRGNRLGEKLMVAMMGLARIKGAMNMTLEVRVSNTSAKRLYSRIGFKENGIRKKYYTDNNEDALIMWCEIPTEEVMNQWQIQSF